MKQFNIVLLMLACFSGVFTQSALAQQASKSASANTNNFSKDTIHIVGHSHMDMNWLWTYFETMKMCNDNLRQTVAFMEEFPDFTMIQSQGAVFKFVEKVDPPLFEKIRKYVQEGRLELGGGMWTEGDTNLPSGEAISRSFLLGQRYFGNNFGRMATVGWLPDNFGHVSQLPQMLKLAGMDYYYFRRCRPHQGSFWWEGTDGSKVLSYSNYNYNGTITPNLKDELKTFAPDKNRILHVTGVGDHGGGPTRANIEMIHKLDSTPDYPAVKFTTANDFFRKMSNEMDGRPTHKGEMQFVFEGCYTTVSELKSGNRNSENNLYGSEFFNTLRWINGDKYPHNELNDLWETVTFNQFHDILPGASINEANKQAIARYTEVERMSKELKDQAFLRMADEVKFQEGLGQPVVGYNLFPTRRKAIVEATVFSYEEPASVDVPIWWSDYFGEKFSPTDEGDNGGLLGTALVRDSSGKTYPAQITYSKMTPPGYTSKVQFVDEDFPAGGYKTYYVDMTKRGESTNPISTKDNVFETDFFIVKFDMKKGAITSLFDKRSNTEYVKEGGELNQLKIYLEDKKGPRKSWEINKIMKEEVVSNVRSVRVIEKGPVRACVETVKVWGNSRFIERVYIYNSYPRIEYDMEVHWLETGSPSTDSPMLRAIFPLNIQDSKFYCQVPFDVLERTNDNSVVERNPEHDAQEVPAQKWVDVTNGTKGIALLNKTKYGHSYLDGNLRLTLMRAAGEPDLYPNLGKFNISYALYPHEGDWTNGVWLEGDDYNVPIQANEPPSLALVKKHATRPEEDSFISLDAEGVYMTGFKKAEDSEELIVRMVETEGKQKKITLNLFKNIKSARKLNLIEMPISDNPTITVKKNSVSLEIKPNEILTLGIRMK